MIVKFNQGVAGSGKDTVNVKDTNDDTLMNAIVSQLGAGDESIKILESGHEIVLMPVCPYCMVSMRAIQFNGYYESFSMWECNCEKIPHSETEHGSYA